VSSSGCNRNYPLKAMVADIYETASIPRILDVNKGQTIGYSELASNTFNGKRQWAATAYVPGPNVTLWASTHTSKIIFHGDQAVGVELLENTHGATRIMANKEVIVCSGAQGSAQLLLLRYSPLVKLSNPKILTAFQRHWSN
jgi:choline dehydrogenase